MRNLMVSALVLPLSVAGGSGAQEQPGTQVSPASHQLQFQTEDTLDWRELLARLHSDFDVEIRIRDSSPRLSVHLARETESDGHGLLGLTWQHREIANLELIELGERFFVIANATGQVHSKAPLGRWHLEEEGSLSEFHFYSGPAVGALITNVEVDAGP